MNRKRAIPWLLAILLLGLLFGAGESPPVQVDPHQHLREILERPMYRAWKLREQASAHELNLPTEGIGDWLKRGAHAIGSFLDWLFQSRTRSYRPSAGASILPSMLKFLGWTIVIVAVLVILYFVIRATSGPKQEIQTAHVLSRQQVEAAMESGNALALDAAQWLDEAQRLAAEQNFRAVYRALYLALLSGLHSAGKIEHNPNRTNWMYVQLFLGPDQERVIFSELTELFDRVWYGRKMVAQQANFEVLRGKVAMLTNVERPA